MQLSENINKKWAPVLDHPDLPEIKDAHRRAVTAICLENVEQQYSQDNTVLYIKIYNKKHKYSATWMIYFVLV